LVETRSLALAEIGAFPIFKTSYRSSNRLKLWTAGTEPELGWSLERVDLARPVTRWLDGNSVRALSELYGPEGQLRFIGAFDDQGSKFKGQSSKSEAAPPQAQAVRRMPHSEQRMATADRKPSTTDHSIPTSDNQPPAAHLVGLLTWRFDSWNETAWLCDLRVRAEHRERGIGSRLIEDLMWATARLEARGIMLETQTSNVPAVDFYLGRGFQLVGINTAMYTDPKSRNADAALYFWFPLS